MTSPNPVFTLQPAPTAVSQRLILHLSGDFGTGKTHFSLGAPAPIYYINIDRGTEGVVEKFAATKEIYITSPVIPSGSSQTEYMQIWQEFRRFFGELCAKPEGTIVVDTLTILTELSKNAHFGKTIEIPPNKAYVWQEPLRELVRMTHDSAMNAIFIQRRGDLWGSTPDASGKKPTDVRGFSAMPYEAQASLITYRNDNVPEGQPPQFWGYIEKCRHNMKLMGKVIPDPAIGVPIMDFNMLRMAVHGS